MDVPGTGTGAELRELNVRACEDLVQNQLKKRDKSEEELRSALKGTPWKIAIARNGALSPPDLSTVLPFFGLSSCLRQTPGNLGDFEQQLLKGCSPFLLRPFLPFQIAQIKLEESGYSSLLLNPINTTPLWDETIFFFGTLLSVCFNALCADSPKLTLLYVVDGQIQEISGIENRQPYYMEGEDKRYLNPGRLWVLEGNPDALIEYAYLPHFYALFRDTVHY